MRGSVLSFSFVEPHTADRPKEPDEPAPRHASRNVGLQDLTLLLRLLIGFLPRCACASTGNDPSEGKTGKQHCSDAGLGIHDAEARKAEEATRKVACPPSLF